MAFSEFWNEVWVAALVNHLWQSTVVAVLVWILAIILRKNHASTRYWVWLVASLKFLLPFSLLIHVGESLRPIVATSFQSPKLIAVLEKITQPFLQSALLSASSVDDAHPALLPQIMLFLQFLFPILLAVWLCGFLVVVLSWLRGWLQLRAIVHSATPVLSPATPLAEVPVISSPKQIEPGIFGIVRPVLLLPEGIGDRLSKEQLNTIIAHEMCHVRRRDNLTAALHIVVEALFWFCPAVWLIKSRMLEERERACDESVLQSGNEAELYAESILSVCKFAIETPPICVSAATGSDLNQRIVRIMTAPATHKLDLGRKLLLGLAATVTLATPVFFGLVHLQQDRTQTMANNHAQNPIDTRQGTNITNKIIRRVTWILLETPEQPPQPGEEVKHPVLVPVEMPSANHTRLQLNWSGEPNPAAPKTDSLWDRTARFMIEAFSDHTPDQRQIAAKEKI